MPTYIKNIITPAKQFDCFLTQLDTFSAEMCKIIRLFWAVFRKLLLILKNKDISINLKTTSTILFPTHDLETIVLTKLSATFLTSCYQLQFTIICYTTIISYNKQLQFVNKKLQADRSTWRHASHVSVSGTGFFRQKIIRAPTSSRKLQS